MEVAIDASALSAATGRNGVPVPALVEAFRAEMNAPEHAQYVHWGGHIARHHRYRADPAPAPRAGPDRGRFVPSFKWLGGPSRNYADLPMAARTYGQLAAPTTFGAIAAAWGQPFLRQIDRLVELRPRLLTVSLSGAAGTASALGPEAPALRAALAEALDLADPGASWHSARDGIVELGQWLANSAGLTAKIGADMERMCQSGRGTLALGSSGGSSTMPQKANPVGPSVLIALGHHTAGLSAGLAPALAPTEQRDGGTWFAEWLSLPPLVMAAGRAVALAADLVTGARPNADAMAAELNDPLGLIDAEAYSFALSAHLPRPEAQSKIKALCIEAQSSGTPLADLIARDHPGLRPDPATRFGQAPAEARAFADAVAARLA